MAERVFVHIGAPKSGTTYLQTLLWSNKEKLADAGVLMPGNGKFDHNRAAQAVRLRAPEPQSKRTWQQLLREVHDWPGTAVLSNEWFSMASETQARRAIGAFAPSEVHVVATARDLVRVVPSAWQETVKLGTAQPLSDFISSLDISKSRWRWSTLDPALALSRWQASLPGRRVHLVTVAPASEDRSLLWQRFATVCGIDAEGLDLDAGRTNESIGAESARLLQLVGPRLREAIDVDNSAWNNTYRWIRDYVSHDLLVPRGGSPIGMGSHELKALRERSQQSIAQLAAGGYDVVGDLDELVGADVPGGAVHPDNVSDAVVLDLAQDVMAALLGRVRDESRRADQESQRAVSLQQTARAAEEALARTTTRPTSMPGMLRAGIRRARRIVGQHSSTGV
ncbi:MAG: hypothetical protein ACR2LE_00680 [Nocardioidaceae bacterium]